MATLPSTMAAHSPRRLAAAQRDRAFSPLRRPSVRGVLQLGRESSVRGEEGRRSGCLGFADLSRLDRSALLDGPDAMWLLGFSIRERTWTLF
jgi:hypothetical protein